MYSLEYNDSNGLAVSYARTLEETGKVDELVDLLASIQTGHKLLSVDLSVTCICHA
jgi:hypothetical protein